MQEIKKTIEELENGSTSFASCSKLADLYIVCDHYKDKEIKTKSDDTEQTRKETLIIKEYSDILPQYQHYTDVKRKYQLNEVTEQAVLNAMSNVCTEIKEFVATLYANTELPEERAKISGIIKWLYDEYAE